MSKAILFYQPGAPDVQSIETVAVAATGDNEVAINVQAIGLNRSDLNFRQGLHPMKPLSPSCNGAEAVGIIESIGVKVTGFQVGDYVAVVPHMDPQRGTYAERIVVAAERVMPACQSLSVLENAALWASYMTAYGGLIETAQLAAGEYVIINAASSSVGLAAIQIANSVGAHAIALTRDKGKRDRLRACDASSVLISNDDDLVEQLSKATNGKGARVVFDPVGGTTTISLAAAMAERGIYVLYGVLSGEQTPFPVALAFEKLISMTVFRLDYINRPEELGRAKAFLDSKLAEGLLTPIIDKVFAFDEVVEAHRYMESNQQFGKIVLKL